MPDLTQLQYFKLLVISAMMIVSQLAVVMLHFLQSNKVIQSCYNYQYRLFNFFLFFFQLFCTACDQLPPAACITCLGEYTDAVSIYNRIKLMLYIKYSKKIIILISQKHRLLALLMLMQ